MENGTLLSAELKLAGRLDARFFTLLEALDRAGSINRAARAAGLSYKGAWLLLETAAASGTITAADIDLLHVTDDVDEAVRIIVGGDNNLPATRPE